MSESRVTGKSIWPVSYTHLDVYKRQDTGGAIKGGVRADFYWGSGFDAGAKAGAMKQAGKIWVLLPKEFVLPKY